MTVKLTVVGSMNMDMVTVVNVPPKRGETTLGNSFSLIPGGKGANQAIAAARLGADVAIIGCVGEDYFGDRILENLESEHVHTDFIRRVPREMTGTAAITVNKGDNSIIVVPGANGKLIPDDLKKATEQIQTSDVVLLQLEIPMETVITAAKCAKDAGTLVILNPAPFRPLPAELIETVDYVTPNELEFDNMMRLGIKKETARKMIVTKGKAGTQYFSSDGRVTVPTYSVDVVDTTGAGDAFNGALAYAFTKKKPIDEAIAFANAAGALSATQLGAQNGLPQLREVEAFLREKHPAENDYI